MTSVPAKRTQTTTDKKTPPQSSELVQQRRQSLTWWIREFLTHYATGCEKTRKYKAEDLRLFLQFFTTLRGHDHVNTWSRATTSAYKEALATAVVIEDNIPGKKIGGRRWAARSINRKLDHLRNFARFLKGQVPCPLHDDVFAGVTRMDVPTLKAKAFTPEEMEALTTAARTLKGTEVSRDASRYRPGEQPLRKTARPLRDFAIFALLKGSGMRVNALCNLNLVQFRGRRLLAVKEKGWQERDVVISSEAAEAIRYYIETERAADVEAWDGSDVQALFLPTPQSRNRRGNAAIRLIPRSVRFIIDKIARKALGPDGSKDVHPHKFRHHVGHKMYEQGGIVAVQNQLGHKNIAYSAVYAQRSEEELEEFLDS